MLKYKGTEYHHGSHFQECGAWHIGQCFIYRLGNCLLQQHEEYFSTGVPEILKQRGFQGSKKPVVQVLEMTSLPDICRVFCDEHIGLAAGQGVDGQLHGWDHEAFADRKPESLAQAESRPAM